jgi:cation/acetate symporter
LSDLQLWTYIIVGISFGLYLAIAIWTRAGTTSEFYIAGKGIHPIANGMATAADWLSVASFMSMAGVVAFNGYQSSAYLMGWTGGYVLLALLVVPYLKQWGQFTLPGFIGVRYYSNGARVVAIICLLVISLTYIVGQMKGVSVTFAHFLDISLESGLLIGMAIMFFYTVLGGMKGITYTQIAQYVVLIFAYTLPAIFISLQLTGHFFPQIGLGSTLVNQDNVYLLERLDQIISELGFKQYTSTDVNQLNMLLLTLTLMLGTAGLPHIIVRFFTVSTVSQVRYSVAWALVFIAILYTTIPALGVMTRYNITTTVQTGKVGTPNSNLPFEECPLWMDHWQNSGLFNLKDHNNDGLIQYYNDKGLSNSQTNLSKIQANSNNASTIDAANKAVMTAQTAHANTPFAGYGWKGNEMAIQNDMVVLASAEIANLPTWLIALVAAGAIAAALSTAAGLLMAISAAISHDLLKLTLTPNISEKRELLIGRIAMTLTILLTGYWGLNPPGFAAEVVALAFGLAAASFFPTLLLGVFSKRINQWGAILGMLAGMGSTLLYIFWFKGWFFMANTAMTSNLEQNWFMGISPEAFGVVGAIINLIVAITVSLLTAPPPSQVQQLVTDLRIPKAY